MKLRFYLRRTIKAAAKPLVELRDRYAFAAVRSGWPVRSRGSEVGSKPFFVIGAPRSGSTLLRAIVSQHPDVFIPPENGGLPRMLSAFRDHRQASWEVLASAVIAEFRRGYEFDHWQLDADDLVEAARALPEERRSLADLVHLVYATYGATHAPGKPRWGDKTVPGDCAYLTKLARVFPDAAYLHLVRDGRDCVASAMKAGMFDKDHAVAAYGWRDSVKQCRHIGRQPGRRFLEIRYEDLVADLEDTVRRACEFLDLEPTREMLHYTGAKNVEDVKTIEHHENVRKPVFRNSIGKWKAQIPACELRPIMRIMKHELAMTGYERFEER